MSLKPLRDALSSAWKVIAAILLVVGGLASLQTLGLLRVLINALSLLSVPIPVYFMGILVAVFVIAVYVLESKRRTDSVLRLEEARRIVKLCASPQATDFLRSNYDAWGRASTVVALTTYGFDDMMKDLEKQRFLYYLGGKWRATNKAFEIVAKYHGGV